jgi:predicted dehydrogenase
VHGGVTASGTESSGSGPRLALIGCGSVAGFHVAAAREAGFEIVAVAGSQDSARAPAFASQWNIPSVVANPVELASQSPVTWDALVIASSVAPTLDLLRTAAATGGAVLAEKPVSRSSKPLRHLGNGLANVLVGYNRRFYSTVQAAKEFAQAGPCVAQLELPERLAPADGLSNVFENSVHGFDMIRFIFGDVETEAVTRGEAGTVAMFRTRRGDVIQYVGNWNAPSNFSLTIDRGRERFQLRPFEAAARYDGLTTIEPSAAIPIRRYQPNRIEQIELNGRDLQFKPGFVQQAAELKRLCNGQARTVGATIADAAEAVAIAEAVTGINEESR